MAPSARTAIVLCPGEGRALSILESRLVLKVVSQDTDGHLLVLEYQAPPRYPGPPTHRHVHTDEAFYVLEGTPIFHLDDRRLRIEPGAFVFIPRGVAHTFSTDEAGPARFLAMMTPAGFEGYFEELADLLHSDVPPPGPEALSSLNRRYDQVLHRHEDAAGDGRGDGPFWA